MRTAGVQLLFLLWHISRRVLMLPGEHSRLWIISAAAAPAASPETYWKCKLLIFWIRNPWDRGQQSVVYQAFQVIPMHAEVGEPLLYTSSVRILWGCVAFLNTNSSFCKVLWVICAAKVVNHCLHYSWIQLPSWCKLKLIIKSLTRIQTSLITSRTIYPADL